MPTSGPALMCPPGHCRALRRRPCQAQAAELALAVTPAGQPLPAAAQPRLTQAVQGGVLGAGSPLAGELDVVKGLQPDSPVLVGGLLGQGQLQCVRQGLPLLVLRHSARKGCQTLLSRACVAAGPGALPSSQWEPAPATGLRQLVWSQQAAHAAWARLSAHRGLGQLVTPLKRSGRSPDHGRGRCPAARA